MNFTFAITTDYSNISRLNQVRESIYNLNIPNYEVLVIGGKDYSHYIDTTFLYFNDKKYPGWTTKKKNILVETARYENVVLMHDYFLFDANWHKSFVEFGNDWDICSNQQLLIDGKRHFTDWVTWDDPVFPRYTSLSYDDWSRTRYMYMSGGYFIVKKHVVMDNPFNESLMHGQAEDVEWSLRVRDKYRMVCNGNAIVRHNKVHRDAKYAK
jgi:hypothetical protein